MPMSSSSSAGRHGQTMPPCRRAVHVRLRHDPTVVLRVPPRRVSYVPAIAPDDGSDGEPSKTASSAPQPPPLPSSSLFLCPAFARADGSFANAALAGCRAAPGTCPDVHADVSTATRLYPHRRTETHTAPRFDASGGTLLVAAPNEQVATLRVAAGECLVTRALEAARSPLSLCAHYLGPKAACDYGAACQFVHPAPGAVISPDPAAVPAPHPLRSLIDLVAVNTAYPPPADVAARGIGSSPGTAAPPSTPPRTADACGAARRSAASASAHDGSGGEGGVPDGPVADHQPRFQHDPYHDRGWTAAPHSATDGCTAAALPHDRDRLSDETRLHATAH